MHTNDLRKLARETNDGVLRGPALGAADEIDRLRAEIERLTKERDEAIIAAASWESAARLLEAERDEARAMLADAERDMRQRAADEVRNAAAGFDPYAEDIVKDLADEILALPLKHADREVKQ